MGVPQKMAGLFHGSSPSFEWMRTGGSPMTPETTGVGMGLRTLIFSCGKTWQKHRPIGDDL